jgi:hypothetical protein
MLRLAGVYDAQRNVSRRTCGISWAVRDILATDSSWNRLVVWACERITVQMFRYKNSVKPGALALGKL